MASNSEGDKHLLDVSLTSLKTEKVAILRDFCTRHRLEVACTGKRGGCIKADYVNAIIEHVSHSYK